MRQLLALFRIATEHYDDHMGNEAQTLLTEALSLSDHDRADLAAELLASLDEPASESQAEVDQLWTTEIERRSARVLAGTSRGEPWADVRARIERKLAAE